jgi:hypothetical protein
VSHFIDQVKIIPKMNPINPLIIKSSTSNFIPLSPSRSAFGRNTYNIHCASDHLRLFDRNNDRTLFDPVELFAAD